MEICLSTLRALLLAAADVDGGELQEAEADHDREAWEERVRSISESENIGGKEASSKEVRTGAERTTKELEKARTSVAKRSRERKPA